MYLDSAGNKLNLARKTLRARWGELEDSWRDSVAEHYAQDQVEPLQAAIANVLREMEKLADVMAQAHRDCQ